MAADGPFDSFKQGVAWSNGQGRVHGMHTRERLTVDRPANHMDTYGTCCTLVLGTLSCSAPSHGATMQT